MDTSNRNIPAKKKRVVTVTAKMMRSRIPTRQASTRTFFLTDPTSPLLRKLKKSKFREFCQYGVQQAYQRLKPDGTGDVLLGGRVCRISVRVFKVHGKVATVFETRKHNRNSQGWVSRLGLSLNREIVLHRKRKQNVSDSRTRM